MLYLCMNIPFRIHSVFLWNCYEKLSTFILRISESILQQVLRILIPLLFLGSLLSPFLNIWNKIAFLHSFGIQFFVYTQLKNFSNLSLKSSGAYLYNSDLMLSSPKLLPFFVTFKVFSTSFHVMKVPMWLSKFHSNFSSFMFVVFRNYSQYWRNTFSSMFPRIFTISFTSLHICLNTVYMWGWVPYVSCSKFVTNLSQEALCHLLASLKLTILTWCFLCFYLMFYLVIQYF